MGILSAGRTLSIRDILSSLFNMNNRHQIHVKCVKIEPNSQICFILWRAGPACVIKFHSLSTAAIEWSIASKIWRYNNWMNLKFSALIITVLFDTYDCTYELYNNWMNSEFWSLDNEVRFHGFITSIINKMNVKYSRISSCLITTWQNSFCSKDLIQFERVPFHKICGPA